MHRIPRVCVCFSYINNAASYFIESTLRMKMQQGPGTQQNNHQLCSHVSIAFLEHVGVAILNKLSQKCRRGLMEVFGFVSLNTILDLKLSLAG